MSEIEIFSARLDRLETTLASLRHTPADERGSSDGEFSQPSLPDFDMESVKRSLEHDIAHQQPFDTMVELLHEAAYRYVIIRNRK